MGEGRGRHKDIINPDNVGVTRVANLETAITDSESKHEAMERNQVLETV